MAALRKYWPLISLILIAAGGGVAITAGQGYIAFEAWMPAFMGLFLILFATVKIMDIGGFARAFQRYDLLAGRVKPYAFVYPFLELGLGFLFLTLHLPRFTYSATAVLFAFGALGVLLALRRGENLSCACLGSAFNLPLTSVALTENVSMSLMGSWMLWQSFA